MTVPNTRCVDLGFMAATPFIYQTNNHMSTNARIGIQNKDGTIEAYRARVNLSFKYDGS